MARKIINNCKLFATVANTKKRSMLYKNNNKKKTKRVEKLQ
jgi:hypothetical protein